MFTEDLDLFIDQDEFAVPVVAGGISGSGIFDSPGEYVGDNGFVVSAEYQVRCKASLFGELIYDDAVTVNGQSYKVRDNRPLHDGAFCLLLLTKVVGVDLANLLLEDGFSFLLEDGGLLLLET